MFTLFEFLTWRESLIAGGRILIGIVAGDHTLIGIAAAGDYVVRGCWTRQQLSFG